MTSSHMYKLLVWLCCVLCVQYAQAQEKYMFQPIGHNEPIPIGVKKRWGWDTDTSGRWCEPITPANLLTTYKGLIPLGKHDSLALEGEFSPLKGEVRYRYNHYYKRIPVVHSDFTVTTWNGKVTRITDFLLRNIDIDTTKVIASPRQAIKRALDSAKAHNITPYWTWFERGIYGSKYPKLVYEVKILKLNPPATWVLTLNPFDGSNYFRVMETFDANPCYQTCASSYQPIVSDCLSAGNTTIYTDTSVSGCPITTAYAYIPVRGMKGDTAAYCVPEEMEYCDKTSPYIDVFRLARNAGTKLKVNRLLDPIPPQSTTIVGPAVYFGRPLGSETPYIFKDDILVAVNAFWGVSKASTYWSTNGVQGYDGKK
jgi:hypothetical protein